MKPGKGSGDWKRLWHWPTVAVIMLSVLSFTGCGTARRSTSENVESATSRMSTGVVTGTKVTLREVTPMSRAFVTVSADSLLKLPEGAVYVARGGGMEVAVGRRGDRIVVEALGEGGERIVEKETTAVASLEEETGESRRAKESEKESRSGGGLLFGLVAGAIVIIMINRML